MDEHDPDLAALLAWRNGDAAAGKRLFESLFDDLFSFFRNKCQDPEDLLQSTLLACMEAADRFEGRSSFRVFVFSIAKNRLYSHWRTQYSPREEVDIGSVSLAREREWMSIVASRSPGLHRPPDDPHLRA